MVTPTGQGIANLATNTSHYCNGCQKDERVVNFKRCSLFTQCQKKHWIEHKKIV